MRATLLAFLAVLAVPVAFGQPATLRGFVTDASSGQPLPGANVVLEGEAGTLGAAGDADGFYQVARISPGTYVLRVSFVGYEPGVDTLVLGRGDLVTRNVALQPEPQGLAEVVVEAAGGAAAVTAGLQSVRPGDLARVPTPGTGGDLASYLQTLPGVVALGDRGGQLFIRGGTPAHNLVLMDGMLVYQPFHIVGFFSAFPEELISYADVYSGGFGAQYTGAISSVIDVSMRNGNKQRFAGAAAAAPFQTSLRLEGPLKEGTVSFLASIRESLIEQTAPALIGQPLPFRFGDQFVKVHADLGGRKQLSFVALRTHDEGFIDPEERDRAADAARWSNTVYGLRFLSLPRRIPVLAEFRLSTSAVRNSVGDADTPERFSEVRRISTDASITHYLGPARLQWGLFARTLLLAYAFGGLFQYYDFDDVSRTEVGLYVDGEVEVGDRLVVNPGVALGSFPESFHTSFEPRLRAVWRPDGPGGRHQVSAAAGLYQQALTGVTDERDAGSAFIAWLAPRPEMGTAAAFHALAGWQVAAGGGWQGSVEAYYKRLHDLAVPLWSPLARFTTTLQEADGTAAGVDARLELQRSRFYGYVGYALAWVRYETAQDNLGLWLGEPVLHYHPPHDRRHQLQALASLRVAGFDASVRWQFGSGLPYTRPLGFDEWVSLGTLPQLFDAPGLTRLLYNRPYTGRLPSYHRLDVAVERAFDLGRATLTLQGGVINAYDRQNLFYFDLFTARRVDQLPLLPFFGFSVDVE